MVIREHKEKLLKQIKNLENKLYKLQESCVHEVVEGRYGANTGNLCREDNSYWISAQCLDCGVHLHADSGTELYRKLSKSGMISSQYDNLEKRLNQTMLRLEIERKRHE